MNEQKRTELNPGRRGRRSLWDRTWKDDQGHVVIWQMPNVPLIAWAALTVLSLMVSGRTADVFSWLGSAALITWSLLEIFKGSNYFRRALGLLVLVFSVASLIKSI
jgi:hypothetical protein